MTKPIAKTPIGGSYSTALDLNKFLATRFDGTETLNIVFNFKPAAIDGSALIRVSEAIVIKEMRFFERSLNDFLYGNAVRRFKKCVPLTAAYHHTPHHHVHVLIACASEFQRMKIKTFSETFALRNRFIDSKPYIERTRNAEAAQVYNGRFGSDRLIIF